MKKVLYTILIVAVMASICLVPGVAFAQSVTFYAMSYDGQQLASASWYSFSTTTLESLQTEAQNRLESSYTSPTSGLTYTADFSTLYSDPTLNTPITSADAASVSYVYVKYNPQKTITVYQRTVDGVNFGSYTYGPISNPSELFGLTIQTEEPSYSSVGLYLDTNWTSLTFDNYSTAFDNGYVYAYYSQNTYVQFFYVLNGEQTYIYGAYFSNGQPTTPNSSAVNNAIPSGYKIENWYSDSALTNVVTTFPGASGAGMEFYAKLVEDIPEFTVTVVLSLNNKLTQIYQSYTFTGGEVISIPNPSLNGYTFKSFHTAYPCTDSNVLQNLGTATQNESIYAFMTPNSISLKIYYTDSPQGAPYLAHTLSVPYNTTPNVNEYITRPGYSLIKRTSDASGNNIVTSFGPLTEDTTWYCFYSQTVTVSYFTSYVNSDYSVFLESKEVPVGTRAPAISIPEQTGYKFLGYSTSRNGTISSELPVVTGQTNIYLVYGFVVEEGSSVYVYSVTLTLDKNYTLTSPTKYASSLQDISKITFDDVYVSFGMNLNDTITYTQFATPVPSVENSYSISSASSFSVAYNVVSSLDFYNKTTYTFKLLSFEQIGGINNRFYLKFDFDSQNQNFNYSAVISLTGENVMMTEQEYIIDADTALLIDTPSDPNDLLGNGVGSIFGMFFNSVGSFLGDILSYNLFGVLPLWTLVVVPLVLSLIVLVIKAFI